MEQLIKVVKEHWHVPLKVLAFQKWVMQNHGLLENNFIREWQEKLKTVELSAQEQELLTEVILSIEPYCKEFTIDSLLALTNQAAIRFKNGEDKYVLLKYMPSVTYEDTWNEWYRYTRGCVINLEKMELTSYTLPKFFNINEKEYTAYERIIKLLEKGKETIYVKQDGSCIAVSFKDELIITTPGSFESTQTRWAHTFLNTKHSNFLKELKEEYPNLTFVFEYVGPENQIVVSYKKTDMILLHALDSETGRILRYEEVKAFADKHGFTLCQTVSESLEELEQTRDDAEKYPFHEQEGWVVRVDMGDETIFVKMKCADYVAMHRVIANFTNPRYILEAMVNETLDDAIAQIESEGVRELIDKIKDIINQWNREKRQKFHGVMAQVPENLWALDEVVESYQEFRELVQDAVEPIAVLSTPKADRVRSHLNNFSKGKINNPKEEILAKASLVFEKENKRFDFLSDYESYKSLVSNTADRFVKGLKKAVEEYAENGTVSENEDVANWIEEHFSESKLYKEGVEDLEEWEERFNSKKEEFNRIVFTLPENLHPRYHQIQRYAIKKYNYEKAKEELLPKVKREAIAYALRDYVGDEFIKSFMREDLLANEEMQAFHRMFTNFDKEIAANYFPEEKEEACKSIFNEFLLLLKGKETDDSYEVAKGIFVHFPERVKSQTPYFKARGIFSAFVGKMKAGFYGEELFKMFEMTKAQRDQHVAEIQFYDQANVVVDPTIEEIKEEDIDFRFIEKLLQDNPLQDN